ncbi:MAG: cytochrome P450 [Patulibacter minatonensis]
MLPLPAWHKERAMTATATPSTPTPDATGAALRPLAEVPGATTSVGVGREILRIRSNILLALEQNSQRFGNVFQLSAPGTAPHLFLNTPEAAKEVLLTRQDDFRKSGQYKILQRVLGFGLVTSEGELWREHRTIVQPMFAKRALGDFAVHMANAATTALDRWDATWTTDERIDMSTEMSALTLDIVGRALVGTDFSARSSEFGAALHSMLGAAGEIGRAPTTQVLGGIRKIGVGRAMRLQPGRMRRMNVAIDVLDDVILEIIGNRRGGAAEHDDLLAVLMDYRHPETGAPLTETHVRDELMTFVTAGHETTANGLTWMWSLLSQHPEARERLVEEVDEVLGGRVPTAADLDALPWATACFQEAMRLFPPVWMVQRAAKVDTQLAGYFVPAGTVVSVSPWVLHHDPEHWPNPYAFDPRRFLGDAAKQRPRTAYLPFAAGRRMCIGQGFAMMEATLLTAMLTQRYTFDLLPGTPLEPEPTITLRPRYGMPMQARRR